MYTLLPDEHVKDLQKEYRIRVLILGLFCISGAIWIGVGSMLPAYIISVIQEQAAEKQAKLIQATTAAPTNQGVAHDVVAANQQILKVKNAEDPVLFSAIIEEIADRRIPGIVINDIEVVHAATPDDPTMTGISIRGTASTRDVLNSFQKVLAADPEFTKVVLPISDLAKGTDIDFSMTVAALH